MGSDLILTSEQDSFTERQMAALRALGVQDAGQGDLALFLNQAQRTGLDPFSKQIYMIGRRQKVNGQWVTKQTIQVGIDGFRLIARRTIDRTHEKYSAPDILWCDPKGGWHDAWIWDMPPVAAKATVVRGDGQFSAVALYREYVGLRFDKQSGKYVPNSMWEGKPALMLGKCAEALALRKAFPMELSGLYTADEMQQADSQTVQPTDADPVGEALPEDMPGEDVPVQDGEVMATTEQANAINRLVSNAGVDTPEKALVAFKALTGRDIDSARYLSQIDAENLLSAPELVASRTKEALREYAKHATDVASSNNQDNNIQTSEKEYVE